MTQRGKYLIPIVAGLAVLLALVVVGCYHRTPEQRAEHAVRYLVTSLNLNADQTAKLEKIKEDCLARRADMLKTRNETVGDLKAMMLSDQLDRKQLASRMEKIDSHANETIAFLADKFAELHDLLTPEQRSKLATEMEKHMQQEYHW